MNPIASRFLLLALAGWMLLPTPVWAWGSAGHGMAAVIAGHFLTPVTQAKIRDMLGSRRLDYVEVACWPDIIRGDKSFEALYPRNGRWHYSDFDVALPAGKVFALKPSEDGENVVDQIGRWRKELADPIISPERRLDALRFLVHFVGDVHQPLHCAYRDGDMGGNMIPVHSFHGRYYAFDADTPMDYRPNLHSTWDEYLVVELLAGMRPKTLADRLARTITPEQRQAWRTDEALQWAGESYEVARKHAYVWSGGGALPSNWSRPGLDLTGANYIDANLPLVREQLLKAGVRLAHVLNAALDPDYLRAPAESAP